MDDLSGTREIWEDVIGEFPKMWMQDTYEGYEGKYWSLPPRKILPKPYKKPHPPMWYAAGNTSSYAMCAQKGLGVLGFSVQALEEMGPVRRGVQERDRERRADRCVRERQRDDHHGRVRARRRRRPRSRDMVASNPTYLQSNVYRYHDTFPHPDWVPQWPELLPEMTEEMARASLGERRRW